VSVDVRIVAATNRRLQEAVAEGVLRQDLYYRLAVVVIELPPLRERREDVPTLVRHFNERMSAEYGLSPREVSPEAMDALMRYDWPGNVRELENVIERAFAVGGGVEIRPDDLPVRLAAREAVAASQELPEGSDLQAALDAVERAAIIEALRRCEGNRVQAAKALGVERKKLYRLLHKHGLMAGREEA
jgi:DNA-binding NtrC family response regulator